MRNTKKLLALAGASALAMTTAAPSTAEACGGLFCGNIPVVQAEEGIIFEVVEDGKEVTAIINIVYQGAAADFAWVLPMQTNPTDVNVGSRQAFLSAQFLTAPSFRITEYETVGMCDETGFYRGVGVDDTLAQSAGGPPNAETDGGVNVVSREEVGPYDTVVLEGRNPEAVENWLLDNGYRVTPEMMEMVTPYLAQGDTLIALKLLNDKDVGEITPLEITMKADERKQKLEACVPIRMTAMAANTDMPITAYIFTDDGRAIPQNFFHVKPNLLKIDWIRGGQNYKELISQAVDEADKGHAFVTEYAGSPSIFQDQVYIDTGIDLDELRRQTDLADFLNALQSQGIIRRPGVQAILASFYPAIGDCNRGCQAEDFRGTTIEDVGAIVDAIDENILAPDRRAQDLMTRRDYFTRLYTLLDPDEMTQDPQFAYRRDLEDVSNVHEAKMIQYCGLGGTPGSAGIQVVLEDGRSIYYDSWNDPDTTVIDAMPAAERVEQLYEDRVVRDNSNDIADLLGQHNSLYGSGCDCDASTEREATAMSLAAVGLLGLGLLLRRRRR